MKLVRGVCAVAVTMLLGGCVTTTTTVSRSVDRPVPVMGLNVLYVDTPLTATSGDDKGSPGMLVSWDVMQVGGAVTRLLPPKLEDKAIPTAIATREVKKGGPSIKLVEVFPDTGTTRHLLIITPVSARETCKTQAVGGVKYDCITRLTVTARLLPPGKSEPVWESRLQEAQVRRCGSCAARFDGFAGDIAEAVAKVVVKQPLDLSKGLASQLKLDETVPLFDMRQKQDDESPIFGARPK